MPNSTVSFFVKILLIFILIFGPFSRALAVRERVTVAVIDGGVDESHPALSGKILKDLTWDFVNETATARPQGSHATKVAGIIASAAPEARIMSLSVCDWRSCPVSLVTKAIRYAADHDADIINLSLATAAADGFTEDFNDAIKYAYDRGVLVVAAAGNDGVDLDERPQSPVCNDNGENMVLGVGSLDKYDVHSSFSNYGGCTDVYFLGENVETAALVEYDGAEQAEVSGTSYAAAGVSGLAARIKIENTGISRTDLINEIKRNSPRVLGESTQAYLIFGADGRTVYLIQNGQRRGFPTPEVFFSFGYNFQEVGQATETDLMLPEGETLWYNN